MSKLPPEFVKAPSTQPKPRVRPARKASLISPDPVRDPRELILHLTDGEYHALEEARQRLHQAGAEVTLDQMIHRVFADWILRAQAATQPAPASTASAASAAPREEDMIARLRTFVAAPLRTWRELATQTLRRGLRRATSPNR